MSRYYNDIKVLVQDYFCVEDNEIIQVTRHETVFKWEGIILKAGWSSMVSQLIVTNFDGVDVYRANVHGKRHTVVLDRRNEI